MSEEKQHITPYSTYVWILAALLILTTATVTITNVNLGTLSVTAAMVIASIKATLVLMFFMHLKFDNVIYRIMVSVVLLVFFLVIAFTFVDYLFR